MTRKRTSTRQSILPVPAHTQEQLLAMLRFAAAQIQHHACHVTEPEQGLDHTSLGELAFYGQRLAQTAESLMEKAHAD